MKVRGLKFLTCDDWLIIAVDQERKAYYVITELWEEWLDLPEGADQEENAVAKYMLPIAFKEWDRLSWKPVIDEEGRHVKMGIQEEA